MDIKALAWGLKMPLKQSLSWSTISENIEKLIAEGYPRPQAIAIALERVGKSPDKTSHNLSSNYYISWNEGKKN